MDYYRSAVYAGKYKQDNISKIKYNDQQNVTSSNHPEGGDSDWGKGGVCVASGRGTRKKNLGGGYPPLQLSGCGALWGLTGPLTLHV